VVPNRVVLLADQRWLLQVLGRTAALLVALVCASIFVNTARADDLGPTDPSGTPSTSAPAPDADTPTATDAPDTDAAVTDDTSAGATDPNADVPAPDPTSTGTDPTATTASTGSAPQAPGCTPTPSDPTPTGTNPTATTASPGTAPEAAGCTPSPSDPTPTGTDPTATTASPGTAPEASGGTGAADIGATSTVPAAPGFSTAQASAGNKRPPKRRSGSDAVNDTTDSAPPASEPAPADDGSNAPDNSGTPSGLVNGPSTGFSTSAPARPKVASDLTTAGSLLSASFLHEATADSGPGGRTVPISPPTLDADVRSIVRPQVDRHVVACALTVSASVGSASERILLARLPAHVDTNRAARSGATSERKGHPNESRKRGPQVPPAPDNDKPLLPPAPSSSLGSGGSGGTQGKDVYGVVTARLSLIPPRNGRLLTLVEKQRRALRLFFILERPG